MQAIWRHAHSRHRRIAVWPAHGDRQRLEFGVRGLQFDPGLRAFLRREREQARRLGLGSAAQRDLAGVEIHLANLAAPGLRVGVVGGGKRRLGRQLAEIQFDDRRRPRGHIDLGRRLRHLARQPAALSQNVEPQGGVRLGRVERVRLADIGERLGERARPDNG